MKNWYSISNKSSDVLDISIHDEIGMWGVSASEFMFELKQYPDAKVINLSIHSPGGNVLDGFAIYNSLKNHPAKVYGYVEGIAASAASFILMASDDISMPEDAFIMIHNAHGGVFGDAKDMREMADIIDKLQESIINIYERRTGLDRQQLIDMMKEETWMNSGDAMKYGFTDNVTKPIDVAAKIAVYNKYFKTMPVNTKPDIDNINNVKDFQNALRDAGMTRKEADTLISRAKAIFQGDPEETDNSLSLLSEALNKVRIPAQINETSRR